LEGTFFNPAIIDYPLQVTIVPNELLTPSCPDFCYLLWKANSNLPVTSSSVISCINKQIDRETDRQKNRLTGRQPGRKRDKETGRQAGLTGLQTGTTGRRERQTDRCSTENN
jgi:hypothetical protein